MFNKRQNQQQQQEQQPRHGFLDKNADGIPDYIQKETIPSLVAANKDLNIYELDTIQEVESFIRALQGYEYDPTENVWVKENEPIINDYGVRKIKIHMETLINKHSQTTNLPPDVIHEIIKYHIQELIRWFKLNFRRLDCNLADLSSIISEFDNKCFVVMSKSIGGGQRQAMTDRNRITSQALPANQVSI